MEIETSTWMMIFFVISLVASIYKIYVFLPNKELADDDTTEASQEELLTLVVKVIKECEISPTSSELFQKIKADESFDEKHFWRFNQNRLNQLLSSYYMLHVEINSIEDIYKSNR